MFYQGKGVALFLSLVVAEYLRCGRLRVGAMKEERLGCAHLRAACECRQWYCKRVHLQFFAAKVWHPKGSHNLARAERRQIKLLPLGWQSSSQKTRSAFCSFVLKLKKAAFI